MSRKGKTYEEIYGIEKARQMCSKQSKVMMGHKVSEETRNKLSVSNTGKKRSEETKQKLRELYLGKTYEEIHGKEEAKEIKSKMSLARKRRVGDLAPSWKGGRYQHSRGYILIYEPNHPGATKRNYVFEHVLVMEKHLGRYLKKGEVVHHINWDIQDNRIENLHLFENNGKHKSYHRFLENCVKDIIGYKYYGREKEYAKEQYKKHREKRLKKVKEYASKNKDKIKEYHKIYYQEHKDKRR